MLVIIYFVIALIIWPVAALIMVGSMRSRSPSYSTSKLDMDDYAFGTTMGFAISMLRPLAILIFGATYGVKFLNQKFDEHIVNREEKKKVNQDLIDMQARIDVLSESNKQLRQVNQDLRTKLIHNKWKPEDDGMKFQSGGTVR